MQKRGVVFVVLLVLFAVSVTAQKAPDNCYETYLPSYKEYATGQARPMWDQYSAQTAGVCRIDRPARPEGGDCKFQYQLVTPEYGVTGVLCWYGSAAPGASVPSDSAAPPFCYGTYLPDYPEYQNPTVRQRWDMYSAQSDGVCRVDHPNRASGCLFKHQLATPERGVTAELCWYKRQEASPAPVPEQKVRPEERPPLGFFQRLRNWWADLFDGDSKSEGMSFSQSTARKIFKEEVIDKSELPGDAYALMYNGVLPAGSVVQDGPFNGVVTNEDTYFAWIEPLPGTMYGHPTVYMFLFADKSLEVYRGNAFPVIDGKDLRDSGSRFYEGSGPTGGIVGAIAGVNGSASDVAILSPDGSRLTPRINTAGSVSVSGGSSTSEQEMQCPPGYVKQPKEVTADEMGVAITVTDTRERRIQLEAESQRFLSATTAAGFENGGMVTTPAGLSAKLSALAKRLEPPSSFAMHIATHGSLVWDIELRGPNGQKRTLSNVPDMLPGQNMLGLPRGWSVVSKTKKGFCYGLGGQCVVFSANDLAPIKSCRKFLSSSACYSGQLTDHNVKGLSVYAGSQADRPGLAIGGKSVFGDAFTTALLGNPPKDPKNPQKDEPKPEFDAAFKAAAGAITGHPQYGQVKRIPIGRNQQGQIMVLNWRWDQAAQQKSIPHDENCRQAFICVPYGGPPPRLPPFTDPDDRESSCETIKSSVVNKLPKELDGLLADPNYKWDKLTVVAGMIRDLESLKECYKCPPGKTEHWKGCEPQQNAHQIIDQIVAGLRSIAQNQFRSANPSATMVQVQVLINRLQSCTLECKKRPITGSQPRGQTLVGGDGIPVGDCRSLGIAELFDDRIECKRYCTYGDCDRVPASGVATPNEMRRAGIDMATRCYMCRSRQHESLIDKIGTGGYIPGTEPVTTTPQTDAQTVVPSEPVVQDCGSVCSGRGMSSSPPSSSSIMSQLQQHRCVSGASIRMARSQVGNCMCYGEPQITINQDKPYCRGTPCGDVPCDGQASCPCPNKPNCQLTVTCSWGGWEEIAEYAYRPIIGTS